MWHPGECQNHLLAKLVRITGELIVVLCDVSWKGKLLPIALPRVQGKFPGQYLHTKSEGGFCICTSRDSTSGNRRGVDSTTWVKCCNLLLSSVPHLPWGDGVVASTPKSQVEVLIPVHSQVLGTAYCSSSQENLRFRARFCLHFLPDLSSLLLRKSVEIYQAPAVLSLLDIWDVGFQYVGRQHLKHVQKVRELQYMYHAG